MQHAAWRALTQVCAVSILTTQAVGGGIARLLKLRPPRTSSKKKWRAHERSTFVVHPVRLRRRSISPRVVFNNPNVAVELPRLSAVLNNTYKDARHVHVTESEFDPSRGQDLDCTRKHDAIHLAGDPVYVNSEYFFSFLARFCLSGFLCLNAGAVTDIKFSLCLANDKLCVRSVFIRR
jgi:hypothetical protein